VSLSLLPGRVWSAMFRVMSRFSTLLFLVAGCSSARSPEQICAEFGLVPNAGRTACECPPDLMPTDDWGCIARDGGLPDADDSGTSCDATVVYFRDADGDGFGDSRRGERYCSRPVGYVANSDDCDDSCRDCSPAGAEICEGERDENCSGTVDEGCNCATGAERTCLGGSDNGVCSRGSQRCDAGSWGPCVGRVDPVPETCDGMDNDCNGATDDGLAASSCGAASGALGVGCNIGECVVSRCGGNLVDCDLVFSNGCETTLGTRSACVSCGDVCGWSDCDPPGGCDGAIRVSAGGSHTCATRRLGALVCWGLNIEGQVGDVSTMSRSTPVEVSTGIEVDELSLGFRHTCIMTVGRNVMCWGGNADGQLGLGDNDRRTAPVAISGLNGVVSLSAGSNHTCVAISDGTVRCWGSNTSGQLGDMTTSPRNRATGVGITEVEQVALGGAFSCARRRDGSVWCWGDNSRGQIGRAPGGIDREPVRVDGVSDAMAIAAGGAHVCALRATGQVVCWGANAQGQLGVGSTDPVGGVALVAGLGDVEILALGGEHSCALETSGRVACWGSNELGQLGIGIAEPRTQPEYIAPIGTRIVSIEAGVAHTCAVDATGAVWCWGFNDHGQLGTGLSSTFSPDRVVEP
jgi:alpha-tubulin suppressor-like RCC1 family protein